MPKIALNDIQVAWAPKALHRALAESSAAFGWTASSDEVAELQRARLDATRRGTVIHLGELDYSAGQKAGTSGLALLKAGVARSPFEGPWIVDATTTFSRGQAPMGICAIVRPEAHPIWTIWEASLTRTGLLFLWSRARFDVQTGGLWPEAEVAGFAKSDGGTKPAAERFAAVINTTFAAVAVLNTRGVGWRSVRSETRRSGKVRRVGHHKVASPYFTTLREGARDGAAGADEGAARRGPRPHLRRGHIRTLSDRVVWVRDCLVGVHDSEAAPAFLERTAYRTPTANVDGCA